MFFPVSGPATVSRPESGSREEIKKPPLDFFFVSALGLAEALSCEIAFFGFFLKF